MRRAVLIAGVAALVAAPSAAAAAPRVDQMIVFRSGKTVTKEVSTRAVTVRVEGRRCAAGAGTPLAALVRSRPGRIRLRDYGSCTRRARDASGLFVSGIGPDVSRRRGRSGWVYKVGTRAATAGAADPSGPFGRGRLRRGQRVTWFFCRLEGASCQRTLSVRADGDAVTVTGYDDAGDGVPVEGATVHAGSLTATTGPDGVARFPGVTGVRRVRAEKAGMVRSFSERVTLG
jgi:hypothetical protein